MLCRSALVLTCLLVTVPGFAQDGPAPLPTRSLEPAALPTTAPGVTPAAAPAASHTLPGFGSLFRDFGTDLKRFPSVETGVLLGGAGVVSAAVYPEDREISNSFAGSAALGETLESGNVLGGAAMQAGFAVGTYALGRALGSEKVSIVGADLIRAQMLTTLFTQAIKFSTQRTRPDGLKYSFPSGHTSSSFATATVLQRHYGWKAGIPAYALATYVAASRVQDRHHYLSDVVFGAALGVAAGRTVTIGRGTARFAMAPIAADGGGGVAFTWVGRN